LILPNRIKVKFIIKIFLLCSALITITAVIIPKRALSITVQQEEELSREFMKVVLKHFELIKDPIIVNYINNIGEKIISVIPPQPFTYRFYIIKEDVYNAFASPAGNIFINSGLLVALENEDELAGILTHEIAHVASRHISQKIARSKKIGAATIAGVVAGILLGAGGATTAAQAVTMGTMAAGQSMALAYSREDEIQADQIGLKWLTQAGYSGEGMLSVLKKLRSKQWFGTDKIPTYLRTHPASEERIVFINTLLEKNKKTSGHRSSYDFERAHTWITAIHGDENIALKKYESDIKKDPTNHLAHYGYGLVLAKTRNRKDAANHFKKALEKRAFDPYILKDLGKIYFLDGRYTEALNVLAGASSIALQDPEVLFYLGRTQLELKRLKNAVKTFEDVIAQSSDYPQAFYYLGETYSKMGMQGDAHYYLAFYYKEKANLKTATFHLKRALEITKDPNKRIKIKEMLEKIRGKKALAEKEESKRAQ
jgi:predicted Zn-dependent protease